MNRRLTVALGVLFTILFTTAMVWAATQVPDVIEMNNKAYKKHTKKIVVFHHKKHGEEYAKEFPEFYKNGCGECHHDKDHKPLTNLKPGDEIQNCIECHKIPGVTPPKVKKEWRKKKISHKERKKLELEYHAEVMHDNCKGCHKKFDKKNKTRKAPTTCAKCHKKK